MDNTSSNSVSGTAKQAASSGSAPLPVISLCNNLITLSSYLAAINKATLPDTVKNANPTLATLLVEWQDNVWNDYMIGLQNEGILAEAGLMSELISEGITDQSAYQAVLNPSNGAVPVVINLCDKVTSLVSKGSSTLTQLLTVIKGMENYDKAKIANLTPIVATLNSQFDSMEDQLTEKALDDSEVVIATSVMVGVNVMTGQPPIAPLVSGVARVCENTYKEIQLSSEINSTLKTLEKAWSNLDTLTAEYAQLVQLHNQLQTVITDGSEVLTALRGIVGDWQTLVNAINCSPSDWSSTNFALVKEWAARMSKIQWPVPVTQIV